MNREQTVALLKLINTINSTIELLKSCDSGFSTNTKMHQKYLSQESETVIKLFFNEG